MRTNILTAFVVGAIATVSQAATIAVGNNLLLPNTPNQLVQIRVVGTELINGATVRVQTADGGPELATFGLPPGTDAPSITNVVITGPTNVFGLNNNGTGGSGSVIPQAFERSTLVQSGSVVASGILATVVIDTTGFTGGTYPLLLGGTVLGTTSLVGASILTINNGSITVVPEPASLAVLAGAGLMLLRRKRA